MRRQIMKHLTARFFSTLL